MPRPDKRNCCPARVPAGTLSVTVPAGVGSSTLVPSYYSYLSFFDKSQVGYGAAIATVLTLVIVVVAVIILATAFRHTSRLVGVSLGHATAPVSVSALSGGSGYLAWFVLQRRARTRASPQIEEQPAE